MAQISNNFDYYADQLGLNLNNYIINYDFKKNVSFPQTVRLTGTTPGGPLNDRFGYSTSLNSAGNILAVGAYSADTNSVDAGAVYIFTGSNDSWAQAVRLTGSTIGNPDGDRFGFSTSLNSSGNILAVGAYFADTNNIATAGAVYIFTGSNDSWAQAVRLTGNTIGDPANDRFGTSVSLNSSGNILAVGAFDADTNSVDAGAVYIFTGSNDSWAQAVRLTGSTIGNPDGDRFGFSTSLNSAGNILAVAAPDADTNNVSLAGAVYIFTGSNDSWAQAVRLTGNTIGDPANDQFGYSTSLNGAGNVLAVGAYSADTNSVSAGAVYIFTGSNNSWAQAVRLTGNTIGDPANDRFGTSVSLNSSGNILAVGAFDADTNSVDAGAVYIFTGSNDSWAQAVRLTGSTIGNPDGDRFGFSTSLNSAGNILALGAYNADTNNISNAGAVYIFQANPNIKNLSVFSGLYTGLIRNDNSFFYNQGNIIDFEGTNSVQVQNATGLKNDFFTVYCAYEKTGSGQAILFSTLDTAGSNIYSGFNFGITNFNNYYYEYYDNTYGPRTHITNAKANTAGIVSVNKNVNNVNINIYDPRTETFLYESFPIQTDTNNFSHLTIGSAKVLPFFSGKNYIGKIDQFIFLQESLSSSYLNDLADGFIYDINKTITLSTFEELYSYSGLINDLTGAIFDSSSGVSFTCLNNYSFYDNLGIINGTISGNIIGSNHTASGFFTGYTSQVFNYTNTVNRFFSNIVITGSVTGYELQISGTGLTGTININAGEIVNICGSGIPLTFVSGLTGILSGFAITGIDYFTGLETGIETITNADFTELINFPFSGIVSRSFASSVVTGNYIYNFTIENNGNYITKTEDITFTNQYITGAFISKTSNLTINENIDFIKNTGYLNSIGINEIIYNKILDNQDIIEIYAFEFNSNYSPILNEPAEFNIGNSRFRILENEDISNVSNNGVYNINYNDYANIFDYKIDDIANVSGNYDSIDNILLDFNKTGFLFYSYTGGDIILTGKKDFLYLNGQKLISGINYIQSGSNSYTNINNTSVSITGNITAYNSVLNYVLLTGNVYSYTLPRLYPKNTSSVYINGVKQDRIDFIEKSKFDPINDPLFLENKGKNIYNTDSALEVNK
jgi:hypothetical protein